MTDDAGRYARDDDASHSGAVSFCLVGGKAAQDNMTVVRDEPTAPVALTARRVRLADDSEWHQLRVDSSAKEIGYERLDNEILAGIRLHKAAQPTGGYPPEISRLYGYEAASADPFALVEPYRGKPLSEVEGQLPQEQQRLFQVSLLTGLCWLAAAGIAHRGLDLSTVRWDGQRAQITDFSLSTVTGVPRQETGSPSRWRAPEQQPGNGYGRVTNRDDVWAAGQLIFYVAAREILTSVSQLADYGLQALLAGVFGPADGRPTAREIMTGQGRLGMTCPAPAGPAVDSGLRAGYTRFRAEQLRKHPGAPAPESVGTRDGDPMTPGAAPVSADLKAAAPDGSQPAFAGEPDRPRKVFSSRRGAR